VWAVRVLIDGECASSSTFATNTNWPQVVAVSDYVDMRGKAKPLAFPPFHRTVLSRRDWDIADDLGRIKVLISEGFQTTERSGVHFQPVRNVACFSFHPAPMGKQGQ